MNSFYYFINGINTNIGNLNGWQYRAVRHVQQNSDDDADSYTYHVRTLNRWIHQASHVRKATDFFMGWANFQSRRVLVGHSNGCEIIRHMLVDNPGLAVDEVHLIAPAVKHNFDSNGLNKALEGKVRLKKLVIYASKSDQALEAAKNTAWIRWFNSKWGYGHLGLVGPEDVADHLRGKVYTEWHHGFDHGTYFTGSHFGELMAMIMEGARDATS
jgi:predicted alpha/beta hydrolase family esterase